MEAARQTQYYTFDNKVKAGIYKDFEIDFSEIKLE